MALDNLDVRERISVAEMLVINAINFHVVDTGFFGTLDRVKFDSPSFCAKNKQTPIPYDL